MYDKYLTTEYPNIFFEDSAVGRMKKRIWDASEEEIDEILQKYEIPSEPEIGKAGCYIQTTPRAKVIEKRRKNDIVLVPLGCTENHGMHNNSGLDTSNQFFLKEYGRINTWMRQKVIVVDKGFVPVFQVPQKYRIGSNGGHIGS